MTSLSHQLSRLSAPQTDLFKESGRKVSLLFDQNVAATHTAQDVWEIGVSGLNELKELNVSFCDFDESLFSDSSQNVQRAVLDKTQNQKLDAIIDRFLMLATPYLTLSSTHKALEWLIYRYRIHEYNVSTVLRSILPYHESNIFARIVHILDIKQNDTNWAWLYLHHKELGPELAGNLGIYYSFFACLVTGVIQNVGKIDDSLVANIMPCVTQGIKSTVSVYRSSTCIVISQLVMSTQLANIVVNSLCTLLLQKITADKAFLYLSTILVICQSQNATLKFKEKALKKLLKRQKSVFLVENLVKLDGESDLSGLVECLVKGVVPVGCQEGQSANLARQFLEELLKQMRIDDGLAAYILKTAVENYGDNENKDDFKNNWSAVCISLAKSNVSALDQCLSANSSLNSLEKDALLEFCTENGNLTKCNGVTESLNCPDSGQRMLSVERLMKIASSLKELPVETIESIKTALGDEDTTIVQFVMEHLQEITADTSICETVIEIAYKTSKRNSEKDQICIKSLKALNSFDSDLMSEKMKIKAVNAYLQAALWIKNVEILDIVKNSDLLKSVQLDGFLKGAKNGEKVWKGIMEWVVSDRDEIQQKMVFLTLDSLEMGIIALSLQKNKIYCEIFMKDIQKWIQHFSQIDRTKDMDFAGITDENSFVAAILRANETTALFVCTLFCAKHALHAQNWDDVWEGDWIAGSKTEVLKLLASTACTLISVASRFENWRAGVKGFMDEYLSDVCQLIRLILWLSGEESNRKQVILLLKVLALKMPHADNSEIEQILQAGSQAVVQLLLISLRHPQYYAPIVWTVFECVKNKMTEKCDKKSGNVTVLSRIVRHKEEICVDFEQLAKVVGSGKKKHAVQCSEYLLEIALSEEIPRQHAVTLLQLVGNTNQKLSNRCVELVAAAMQQTAAENKLEVEEKEYIELLIKHITLEELAENITLVMNIVNSKEEKIVGAGLGRISNEFYGLLDHEDQLTIIDALLDLVCSGTDTQLALLAKKTLNKLEIGFGEWKFMMLGMSKTGSPQKRKRHISQVLTFGSVKWLAFLEYAQVTTHLKETENLPTFFEILKRLNTVVDMDNKDRSVHLVLSILCEMCSEEGISFGKGWWGLEREWGLTIKELNTLSAMLIVLSTLAPTQFEVDVVVHTLQQCSSLTTVHLALNLITNAAKYFRNSILMHIVRIFTFMGSSVMHKDDQFSMRLVNDTISTVIPAVAKCGEGSDLVEVLRIISACVFDVAEHRRIHLVGTLLQAAGEDSCWMFVALLLEKLVLEWKEKKKPEVYMLANLEQQKSLTREEELCFDILSEANALLQLKSIDQLLNYSDTFASEKGNLHRGIVNVQALNTNQKRHFTYALHCLVQRVVASEQLLENLCSMPENEMDSALVTVAETLSHTLLRFINANEKECAANKFLGVLVKKRNEALLKLHSLLPAETNLHVLERLLVKEDAVNRCNAMHMLNSLLLIKPTPFTQNNVPSLSRICTLIGDWLRSGATVSGNSDSRKFCGVVEERQSKLESQVLTDTTTIVLKAKEEGEQAARLDIQVIRLIAKGDHFMYIFTDRDGTLESYSCSYPSSIQPAYGAVIQATFAHRCCQYAAMITSAPLLNIGILDVRTMPDGYFCYGASGGREWYIDASKKFKDSSIFYQDLELMDMLADRISDLLEQTTFQHFTWVGSGLQKHYGCPFPRISENLTTRRFYM